jgi:hypothetical protein
LLVTIATMASDPRGFTSVQFLFPVPKLHAP